MLGGGGQKGKEESQFSKVRQGVPHFYTLQALPLPDVQKLSEAVMILSF